MLTSTAEWVLRRLKELLIQLPIATAAGLGSSDGLVAISGIAV